MIRKLLYFVRSLFFNFSTKRSFTPGLRLLFMGILLLSSFTYGQTTWTGALSTNWNITGNWSNGVPNATVAVIIPNSITNKPTISVAGAACASLTMNNTGTNNNVLTITSPGTLQVSGAINMTAPTAGTRNTTIDVSTGTLTAASITMIDSGSASDSRDCELLISTGSVTISGNISMNADVDRGDITFLGAGTLYAGGTITGGTLNAATGTVNYNNGGGQTVGVYSYYNLILSNSGTKVFAVTSITNDLRISGTASATTAANLVIGRNLTVDSGTNFTTGSNFTLSVAGTTSVSGTLTLANTGTKTFTGSATINSGGTWNETGIAAINFLSNLQNDGAYTATVNTGAHTFSGSSKTISGSSTLSIPNAAFTGSYTNNIGTLTISTGLSGAGTLTNASGSTLNIGGTSSITNLNATTAGNIVNYSGTTQSIKATSYANLILSNPGTKTFPASIVAISGNLNINSGVVANLSTVTHTAGTLTLGGATTPGGSWGSTASAANNKNNTFFAATTGLINVSSASCTTPVIFAMTGANDQAYCSTESGTTIGLSGSESGVNYQLYRGTVAVGSPVAGTGLPISFGAFNTTGKYTVTASKVSTLCTATMSGGPITIYKYSSPPTITGTVVNVACPTDATGTISITNASNPASLAFVRASTDAATQGVNLNQTILSNRAKFTVEGWIKFDNLNYVTRMSIFGQNDVIEVAFEADNLRCYTAGGGVVDMPKSEITAGLWYHIAVTGDGTVGGLKIYLNGVLKSSAGNATSNYGTDTNYTTKIGYAVMDANGNGLTGEIFKVGFWSDALSAADVAKLATGFVDYDASFSTLIAGFSFNDGPLATSIAGVGSAVAPIVGTFTTPSSPVWTDPYVYSWTSVPAGYTSTGKNLTGLLPRTYNVTTSLRNCTSSASFTVNATNTAPSITTQPSPTSTCVANNASFTIVGSGTGVNYQWEVSTNGGGTFTTLTNIGVYSNVTTATMNITGATAGMNNYQYRCIVGGTCTPAVTSNPVVLTVNTPSVAPTSISGTTTICNGSSTTLTAVGGTLGTGATYQWGTGSVVGTNPISGATSISYSTGALSSNATYWVRIENTTSSCTATTGGVSQLVTVNTPSVAPTSISGTTTICNGSSTTLTAVGGSLGTGATYQWGTGSVVGTNPISGATLISYTTANLSSDATYWVGIVNTTSPCTATTVGVSQLVTVNTQSVAPTNISGTATICTGQGTTLTVAGGTAGTGAVAEWFTGSCGGISAGTGPSITVSPVTNTTYYVRYAGTCNTTTCASVTVNVTPLPTIVTQPQPLAICENKNDSFTISTSATSPTYLWEYSTNGSGPWLTTDGVANLSGYNTSTLALTSTPLSYSGNYVRCTITSGGCPIISNVVQLTVNPTPTAPTASVTTQPTCAAPTGTITVSSPSPAVGITYSIDGSDYSNTSGVFINVAPNITPYNVTVRNSSLCISPATSVTVNNPSGKVWNGSVSVNWATAGNWTPSGAPGVSDCVVIPSTVTKPEIASGATITVHSITVNSGGLLTVRPTGILTVATSVNVATGGDLVFEDDSSLLQTSTNSTINTGNITYKRISSAVRRYDFTFWSSPVTRTPTPYTLSDVSPLTLFDKYYSFSPATGWVISYSGILPMTSGLGYIIRAPQTYDINTAVVYPATFVGTPNNGTIVVTGANAPISGKSILLGNPYPSALNATTFINDNHNLYNVDIGALYFWTHNSPPNSAVAGDAKYNYTTADYAVFSLTGSVSTSKSGTTGVNNGAPTGIIAAGQAFFMKATSNKDITFTNAMRVGPANDQFFKIAKANDEGKNRLWLNLTNAEGAFKQALVGYLDGATNSWDVNYDGVTLNGNTFLDFYSINDSKRLTIQGRAMPFDNTDLVPLGYVSSIAGDFTIAIDHADGLFDTQPVYLEDKKAGKTVDLRAGDYTFTTAIGTFADRFVLSYVNKTLGTGDFENIENGLLVSVKDKSIKVTSAKETIKEVTIFDINGKLLYNKKKVGSSELQVSNLQAANQVLLVKVVLENGFTTTKKIVF